MKKAWLVNIMKANSAFYSCPLVIFFAIIATETHFILFLKAASIWKVCYFFTLLGRQKVGYSDRQTSGDWSFNCWFTSHLKQPGLGQIEATSLQCVCQGPKRLSHHLLPPRCALVGAVSKSEELKLNKALPYGTQPSRLYLCHCA